jgi:ATP-dependent DNA ligase
MPFTAKVPPSGSDWLHEIKHDGYRVQLRRDGARVTLYTKNGYDWTDRFRRIVAAAREVECGDFVIDWGGGDRRQRRCSRVQSASPSGS